MKKTRYLLIAALILLDQAVKFLVRKEMYLGESIPLWNGVFHFTYVQNTGAAFSMFEGMSVFLTLVPLAALIAAVWYMEKHRNEHWTFLLSMILIISGGLGNLIDRLWLGYVTDLFDFCLINFPVFNVADIGICVGCFFLIVYIFFFDKIPDEKMEQGEMKNEQ